MRRNPIEDVSIIGMLISVMMKSNINSFPASQIQSRSGWQESPGAHQSRQRPLRRDCLREPGQIFVDGQMESRAVGQILSRVFGGNRRIYESQRRDAGGGAAQGLPALCAHQLTLT